LSPRLGLWAPCSAFLFDVADSRTLSLAELHRNVRFPFIILNSDCNQAISEPCIPGRRQWSGALPGMAVIMVQCTVALQLRLFLLCLSQLCDLKMKDLNLAASIMRISKRKERIAPPQSCHAGVRPGLAVIMSSVHSGTADEATQTGSYRTLPVGHYNLLFSRSNHLNSLGHLIQAALRLGGPGASTE
jgi:hypothetical protein